MRRVKSFMSITVDSYFADAKGGLEWAHKNANDPEWREFVSGNAQGTATLLFGRVTYDMMVSYWPTDMAKRNDPVVAERMNRAQKIVVSRKMQEALWPNTTVMHDPVNSVRELKQQQGDDVVILGSGSIVAQLAQHGLIDEYQLVVVPVVIGDGKKLFEGVTGTIDLSLTSTRAFSNGNVVLTYETKT